MKVLIDPDYRPGLQETVVRYQLAPSHEGAFHDVILQLQQDLQTGSPHSNGAAQATIFALHLPLQQFSIAFHKDLFEGQNLIQHLAVISALPLRSTEQMLMILHIEWGEVEQGPGPQYGIAGIRQYAEIPSRPLVSGLLHPLVGGKTKNSLEQAFQLWTGGCDIVEESLSTFSADHTTGKERLSLFARERMNCIKRSKQQKIYLPHISHHSSDEIILTFQELSELGLRFAKINASIGWNALHKLIKHARFSEIHLMLSNPLALAQLTEQISLHEDQLLQILSRMGYDLIEVNSHSGLQTIAPDHLNSPTKRSFPVFSVKDSLSEIEELVKTAGREIIFQVGPPLYHHPDGLKAGAEAARAAAELASSGREQKEALAGHPQLKRSLEQHLNS